MIDFAFLLAPGADFRQSLDGRSDLGDELFGSSGWRAAEFCQVDHSHELPHPGERADEVAMHAISQRRQLTDVILAGFFTVPSAGNFGGDFSERVATS